jgi:polyferredoxin
MDSKDILFIIAVIILLIMFVGKLFPGLLPSAPQGGFVGPLYANGFTDVGVTLAVLLAIALVLGVILRERFRRRR